MKLIVGLGNPESRYAGTRHNLGFDVLDELVRKLNLVDWVKEDKFKAELIKTPELILVKPQTFMNNSGMAVRLLVDYFKISAEDIIVVYDELDLPLGKIKVRMGGAAAGHHGVESITSALGTGQFIRARLGIGNLRTQSGEHKGQSLSAEKFVLEPFMPKEKTLVKHMIRQAIKALDLLLEKGLESAQNQFN
ncbi:MAG: aminoacyl-tRNA hydrolase [Candidatus Daviesbacteria bacterium]|nr:aminoacyl-tRNA hydrolase [Candidatus Daviesbacteria bacterium]